MSEQFAIDLLKQIKSTNDKKLQYKLLVKIRTEIIKDEQGIKNFFNSDGVKILINFLHKPHEKILDVTLSILGNCCVQSEIAKQAYELGIVKPVLTIISNIANPNIQGRGCRLLGNIVQNHKERIKVLQEHGVIDAIHSILVDSNNITVLTMAIRLLKYIWDDRNIRYEIISMYFIHKLMEILLKHMIKDDKSKAVTYDPNTVKLKMMNGNDRTVTRQKFNIILRDVEAYEKIIDYTSSYDNKFSFPNEKEALDLVGTILGCFLKITNNIMGLKIADHFKCNGKGYPLIVYCGSYDSPFRAMGLKILSNLAENTQACAHLGSADVIIVTTNLLTSKNLQNPLHNSEIKYCIKILCLLTGDSCYRAKIRHSGALDELILRAKSNDYSDQFSLFLFAFFQFRFDEVSLGLMVEKGIVPFLITNLSRIMKDMKVEHRTRENGNETTEIITPKRKALKRSFDETKLSKQRSKSNEINKSLNSTNDCESIFDRKNLNTSRETDIDSEIYSPARSDISTGHFSSKDIEDPDLDSESYSPVCSDIEEESNIIQSDAEENEEIEKKSDEFDIFAHIYGMSENTIFSTSDTEENVKDDNEKINLKESIPQLDENDFIKNPVPSILILLHKVSMKKKRHSQDFVSTETLSTLLKLSEIISNPLDKLLSILENILSEKRYFTVFLNHNFVFDVTELKRKPEVHGSDCQTCAEIKIFAQKLLCKLAAVGESGYGHGELINVLIQGDLLAKQRGSVVTMYIIRKLPIIEHIVMERGAYDVVIDTILNEKDEYLSSVASTGLTILARSLSKVFSGERKRMKIEYYNDSEELIVDECDNDLVTFIVNDNNGSTKRIKFSKNILMNHSDVFNIMLSSDFLESKHKEIKLIEVSESGLKYFLKLLTLKSMNECLQVAPESKDLNSILDAYELSIKYMLVDIKSVIFKIIYNVVNESNVIRLYEWSCDHSNDDTLRMSVLYFLNSNISGEKKTILFRNAFTSKYSEQWLHSIKDELFTTIKKELFLYDVRDICKKKKSI